MATWLGPALIVVCVAVRFGWGRIAGPPFPFWGISYLMGAAGILLVSVGLDGRPST